MLGECYTESVVLKLSYALALVDPHGPDYVNIFLGSVTALLGIAGIIACYIDHREFVRRLNGLQSN